MQEHTEKKKFILTVLIALIVISVSSILMIMGGIDFLKSLVKQYDLLGFFLLITIMNVVVQPVSPDFVIAGSSFFLKHSVFVIASVSGIAGIASGLISYLLGICLGLIGCERLFGSKNTEKGCHFHKKYGVWAIIISTVTPVPYSVVCWIAGIFKMQLRHFIPAVIFTRAPRHVIVAYFGVEITSFLRELFY